MQSLKGQGDFLTRMQWTIMVLMLAMVGAFYALAYRPQTQRLARLGDQVEQTRHDLIEAQTQTTQLPTVQADVEKLRLRLEKFKTLPARDPMDQFVKEMAQITQTAQLKSPVMNRGIPKPVGNVIEIPVTMKFEGDFNHIFAVLRQTEKLQRLTRVPKLNIKSTDNQGQVKAELTLNVYYMAEQKNDAKQLASGSD